MSAASNHSVSGSILIVDDNPLGSVARKSVLAEHGCQVAVASSPEQALDMFSKQSFDLVVTDFKMPGMNGVELIKMLREMNPTIPVVLLSGFTDTLGLSEENTGANVVLQKSNHEVPQLVRAINRLLRPKKPAASQGGGKSAKRKAE